jgi:hypothetical protein
VVVLKSFLCSAAARARRHRRSGLLECHNEIAMLPDSDFMVEIKVRSILLNIPTFSQRFSKPLGSFYTLFDIDHSKILALKSIVRSIFPDGTSGLIARNDGSDVGSVVWFFPSSHESPEECKGI